MSAATGSPPVVSLDGAPARGVRWLMAALGGVCFALAAVGAVVPGLPTTVFLLVGSYLLTRSCPVLERRLRESRLFRPYARYLEPGAPLPARARVTALAGMWLSIGASAVLLGLAGSGRLTVGTLAASGLIGSVVIVRYRRNPGLRPSHGN